MRRRFPRPFVYVTIGLALLTVCVAAAQAQSAIDVPQPPNQPQIPVLKLVKDRAFRSGQAVAVKGMVDDEGLRFTIPSLSILQPVIVSLASANASDELTLSLFKADWKQPRRMGTTGATRTVQFRFRTEGGVNILVQSSGPMRPFSLAAWAGDEIHPHMKDIVVTPAEFEGGAAGASGPAGTSGGSTRWVVAAVAAILVIVAVLVLRRRKSNA
jgi:hypothetical protein